MINQSDGQVMDKSASIRNRFALLSPHLDEKCLRLFAASEALSHGHGGIKLVSDITGIARSTIGRGIKELKDGDVSPDRVRRSGGGRKLALESQPGLAEALKGLVDSSARGDPERPLLWVTKSCRQLSRALSEQGFSASRTLVNRLLRQLGYTLQGNAKTLEGANNPDRDKQFAHINDRVVAFQSAGQPVISVDTKKKELIGNFKNAGRTWRPQGCPVAVNVHDFADKELGKAVPYGVYDVTHNIGWVNVGINHDTSSFAVESIRRWWHRLGKVRHPGAEKLLITADCGGSNSVRGRLWKVELQALARELGLEISVCHLPPGTSKWNRIEHRLFSFISRNWRGQPLCSLATIVSLISATRTETGLEVYCDTDTNEYAKGVKVTDKEMATLDIRRDEFHGEWNYTLLPVPDVDAVVS